MHTTTDLTTGEETRNRLAVGGDDVSLGVDMQATHRVVEHGCHKRDMEEVIHSPLPAMEELGAKSAKSGMKCDEREYLLSKRVVLLPGTFVVLFKRRLENRGIELHLLSESVTRIESLHKTTADVVLAVPLDLLGGLAVEDEPDRVFAVLPDAGV